MPRERYVIRDGKLIQVGGDYRPITRGKGKGLQVIQDIEPYQSPVDDGYVGGRRQRRDDLKRHNCREYEPGEKTYHARERQAQEQRFEHRIGETMQRFFRD